MKLVSYGEVYGIRTGTNDEQGTVAIKIGNKVVRFVADDAHLWIPKTQVQVVVTLVDDEPLVTTQGSIDD